MILFTNWKQKYLEQRHKEEIYLEGLAIQATIFKRGAGVRDEAWRLDTAHTIINMMINYAKEFDLMDCLARLYELYPELKEGGDE